MSGLWDFQGSSTERLLCATVTSLSWLIFIAPALAKFLTAEVKRKSGTGRKWCGDLTPIALLTTNS